MVATLLLLLACGSTPPSIGAIEPTSGPAGTVITITGEGFVRDTTVSLGGTALDELQVTEPSTITGKVPAGLKAGPANLSLSSPPDHRILRSKAFEVVVAPPADPCGGTERRMTHIPPTADVVKIDRWITDEQVERSEIATRDIEAIEYERKVRADGKACAAIWLRTAASRVLFDAQLDVELKEQAQKIAVGLGKPLTVTADEAPPAAAEPAPG